MIELKKHYETFQKLDTQIYALSVDEPEKSQILAKETQLPFELLSDVGRKIIDLYDLHNRDERGGIAYPAEFVINGEGKICYRSLDHTVQRADVSEVIQFLEHLQKDSSYQAQGQKKKWMIPSFLPIKQMWRNLFVRKSN